MFNKQETVISLFMVGGCLTGLAQDSFLSKSIGRQLRYSPLFEETVNRTGDIESFSYGASVDTIYDSNFRLLEENEENRFFSDFSPSFLFESDPEGEKLISVTLHYEPILRADWSDSSRNELLNVGKIVAKNEGGRGSILVFGEYQEFSSPDRLALGFIEGKLQNYGLEFGYLVGSRTRLLFDVQYTDLSIDSSAGGGSQTWQFSTGFDWESSLGWSIGPLFRYLNQDTEGGVTRESYALLLSFAQTARDDFRAQARFGLEFDTFDGQEDDRVGLTGAIELGGDLGEDWTWDSLFEVRDISSGLGSETFIDLYRLSLSAHREIEKGSIQLGANFEVNDRDLTGQALGVDGTSSIFEISSGLTYTVGDGLMEVGAGLSYGISRGAVEWNRFVASLSAEMQF